MSPAIAPPPSIRPATAADAATIHGLIVELGAATGKPDEIRSRPRDFARFGFGEPPAFRALIAEHGGRPVGLALYFYTFSSWRGELGVYLQDLVVTKAFRGQGLGQALIAATAARAQRRGATHLRLSVERNNSPAADFYRSLGLDPCEHECTWQCDGPGFLRLAGIEQDEHP